MSEQLRSVIVRAPITMKIGPVPDNITSHAEIATFGIANLTAIVRKANPGADVAGEQAVVSYVNDGELASYSFIGSKLDDRHYRVQPDGDRHSLELSIDRGVTFTSVGVFSDYVVADLFGNAWTDGRTEKSA